MTKVRYADLIMSSQRIGKTKESNSCILRDDLSGYCRHPLIDENTLKCNYALTEIKVPRDCLLRKKSLTIKLTHRKLNKEITDLK